MEKFHVDTNKLTIIELRNLRHLEYNRWEPLRCPILNEVVYFNKDGFYHLTHNGQNKIRKESDQRMRLNLLPNARTVISKSKDMSSNMRMIPSDQNRYKKNIYYYELTYRFSPKKAVSVVLRRIGEGGRLHYYSIRYNNKK